MNLDNFSFDEFCLFLDEYTNVPSEAYANVSFFDIEARIPH